MTRHIAEKYEEILAEAKKLAAFYSGRKWRLDAQHDPGLTTLQLLANAVALADENYQKIIDSPGLFKSVGGLRRWRPNPQAEDSLVFHQELESLEKKDFQTRPAVRRDLCSAAEKVPGIAAAWILPDEGGPRLVFEFAPALPVPTGSLPLQMKDFEKYQGRPAQVVRRELEALTSSHRGLGQPVLPVRAVAFTDIAVSLNITTAEPRAASRSAIDFVIRFLARLIPAAAAYLRPVEGPRRSVGAADMYNSLSAAVIVPGIEISGLRLNRTGEAQSADWLRAGHDRLEAAEGCDGFQITLWRIVVNPGPEQHELSASELEMAAFLADREILEKLWPKWFPPEPQTAVNDETPAAIVKNDFLHRQFPAFYQLDDRDAGLSGQSAADGRAESLQFQGLLFLFEEILRDTESLMTRPDQLFQPLIHLAADMESAGENPLLDKLTDPLAFQHKFDELLHRSGRDRNILTYLAALQGEEPWFGPAQITGAAEVDGMTIHQWYDYLLAAWLRRLPDLNGRRLESHSRPGGQFVSAGPDSPLESRLGLLMLPFQTSDPRPDQFYFDMRKSANRISGHDEYRCYIRDAEGRLRLIVRHMSASPEEAEGLARLALRLAANPSEYRAGPEVVHVGWLAELPGREHVEGDGQYPGNSMFGAIEDTVEWASSLLPVWIRVVEYLELEAERPFEVAVLADEAAVPLRWRDWLVRSIRREVPAHVLPRTFFLNSEEIKEYEAIVHDLGASGHIGGSHRRLDLLNFLTMLEKSRDRGEVI
ncbi:hypothetical protein C4J81_05665 [Deltaproteobacteria bacterium Smac51]|nr:hypothetical protein C4J81_05665 [Deltaproteobacteria bacterium Smac51]